MGVDGANTQRLEQTGDVPRLSDAPEQSEEQPSRVALREARRTLLSTGLLERHGDDRYRVRGRLFRDWLSDNVI